MPYAPPKNRFEVLQRIEFEEALEPTDPRYVNTSAARGSVNTLKRLAAKFGLDLTGDSFYPPPKKHVLFFGHIGCGKSTELRRYARELAGPQRFYVVHCDISTELDRYNLQYADVLMAFAQTLLKRLDETTIDAVVVDRAVRLLASEYNRFLVADDYKLLVAEDRSRQAAETQVRAHKLLNNLALLEYNDGTWRRSHPAVRILEGYRQAGVAGADVEL